MSFFKLTSTSSTTRSCLQAQLEMYLVVNLNHVVTYATIFKQYVYICSFKPRIHFCSVIIIVVGPYYLYFDTQADATNHV